jgi:signal transduction histidine kinase
VESALRAVAYPVHVSQLLQRQQHTQKENEKHFAFIGHHLKQPLAVVYALAWRLAHCMDTSSATLTRRQTWADLLMEKGTQALEDALTLQTAVIGTPTTVDLIPMLEGLVRDRQLVAENEGKGVRIHFSREARLYSKVSALPARLRVALVALIDNAVKYSWPQETVLLRLVQLQAYDPEGPKPKGVVLWIENYGEGFTKKQKQELYQVGARIPGMSKRHAREGYGLGLTQAKSIVEDYGGTLDIDSESLTNARGTTRKHRTVVKLILNSENT